MEITRQNFKETLPLVKLAIQQADFLTFDCEFTGLPQSKTINAYDTLPEYYENKVTSINDFVVLQFGLATFRKKDSSYACSCFNFYIYPWPIANIRDPIFKCQSSCLSFLATNGFDFNKVFRDGITYLSGRQQEKYREHLTEYRRRRTNSIESGRDSKKFTKKLNLSEKTREIIDKIAQQIDQFLATKPTMNDKLTLGRFNSYIRMVIHNVLNERFQNQIAFGLENEHDSQPNPNMYVELAADSKSCKLAREKRKQEHEDREIVDNIGFTEVVTCIMESGKLMVGHSLLSDLMFTIAQFVQPLPDDYFKFKDVVHTAFPFVIDTKVMSMDEKLQNKMENCSLVELVDVCADEPFHLPEIVPDENAQCYSLNEKKAHEAGFDAFMTGVSFISMSERMGCSGKINRNTPELGEYLNKIFVFRLADIPFMKLDGDDPSPSRDNVVYTWFKKDTDVNEIFKNFQPIRICNIDNTSAYIVLKDHKTQRKAIETLSKQVGIVSYLKYKTLGNDVRLLKDDEFRTPMKRKSNALNELINSEKSLSHIRFGNGDLDLGTPIERKVDAIVGKYLNESERQIFRLFVRILTDLMVWKLVAGGVAVAMHTTNHLDTETLRNIMCVILFVQAVETVWQYYGCTFTDVKMEVNVGRRHSKKKR